MLKHVFIMVLAAIISVCPAIGQDLADVAAAAMDAIREAKMQNAASDDVKAIFKKAVEAEEDGNINFCGFYTGMSKSDAGNLADFYKLNPGEWSAKTLSLSTSVYELWFSLRAVRKLTKGGNSFDELALTVANRIGSLERKDASGGKEWWEYTTIDDVTAIMAEHRLDTDYTDFIREIALFVDKSDISEEIVRFRSHLDQFGAAMRMSEPSGKRLDFLTQEMFREVNTIGSKANFSEITYWVVDMKTIIEKIREMVQNVE